jgi:hypothetical protein
MTIKKIFLIYLLGVMIFVSIPSVYSQGCDFSYAGEILPNGEIPDFIGYGLWENKKYTIDWTSNVSGVVALVFTTENFNIWIYGDHNDFSLAKKVDLTGHFTINSGEQDTLIIYNGNHGYAWVAYTLECEDIPAIPFTPLYLLLLSMLCSLVYILINYKHKKLI